MQSERVSAKQLRNSIIENKKCKQEKTFVQNAVQKASQKIGRQNLAYILMIISQILYPLGFLYSNQHKINPIQTNLIRGMVVTILSILAGRYFNLDLTYKNPNNFKILMVRNFFTCLQAFGYTIVQFYLPQPIVQTLNSTGPLFVFLLDYQINGITVTKRQFIGILLGVSGVILTVNGQLIMQLIDPSYQNSSNFTNYQTSDPKVQLFVALIFIIMTFFWGYAQIITKRLVGVNSIQISLHLAYYLIFTSGLLYPIRVPIPSPLPTFITAIFSGGLLIGIGQMIYFGALILTKNMGNLTMMIFTNVVVGYVVSIWRYDQPVNLVSTTGSGLIIIGLARIVLKEKTEKQVGIQEKEEIQLIDKRQSNKK